MQLQRMDPIASDLLANRRPPWLLRVGEPDQLGVERAHQPLAFVARLVELAEEDRHVAADDGRTPVCFDDDHLRAWRVAWRRDESNPGQQLELAVDGYVLRAGRLDPFADRLVVLAARDVELAGRDCQHYDSGAAWKSSAHPPTTWSPC
jgi:hypothetical protein